MVITEVVRHSPALGTLGSTGVGQSVLDRTVLTLNPSLLSPEYLPKKDWIGMGKDEKEPTKRVERGTFSSRVVDVRTRVQELMEGRVPSVSGRVGYKLG